MRPSLVIAAKDLRLRLRDRSAFVLGILAPLGLALIFGQILPDFGGGDLVVATAVVDGDGSEISSAFVAAVDEVAASGLLELRDVASADEARRLVEDGDLQTAYLVPAGFGAAVTAGSEASLTVVGNADSGLATLVSASIARRFTDRLSAAQIAVGAGLTLGVDDAASLAGAAMEAPDPVSISDATAQSRVLDASTFTAAGMAVFFLFFTVSFGVSSLIAERNDGTLPRLLAAPIGRGAIIAGKAVAAFVVGVVSMLVLVVATAATVGADWGNPVGVLGLVLGGVAAALGIMAFIATLAKTAEQAGNWQSIVAVVLGLLGGTFFPVDQGPDALAKVSLLTPHAWFMRGIAENATGGGLGSLVAPIGAMLVFAVVATALAATRLRRMVSA